MLKAQLHTEKLSIDEYANEDYDPNGPPPGPEFKPTMPAGTVKVDVSDVYDWYKLGQHISNLKGLGKHDFGQGPPSTILSFGDEDTEHKYIQDLEKTGLTTTDIDPVDPNQPKGMKRQKTDPTYDVDEADELDEATDRDSAIRQIFKLKNTQGRSPSEIETAQKIIDNLLQKFNINPKEVGISLKPSMPISTKIRSDLTPQERLKMKIAKAEYERHQAAGALKGEWEKFKRGLFAESEELDEDFTSKQQVINYFVSRGKSAAQGAAAWERGWRGAKPKQTKPYDPERYKNVRLPYIDEADAAADITFTQEPYEGWNGMGAMITAYWAGNDIGHVIFEPTDHDTNKWYATEVEVEDQFQRKGIATTMYDMAKKLAQKSNAVIVPSHAQTSDAKGLWKDKKVWEASEFTFAQSRRKLNVPALIKAGAIFITEPHGPNGWKPDADGFSLITLQNVEHGGWASEAKQHLKPSEYNRAAKLINAPVTNSNHLVYDGKYNQILWSIKKLGIPDNEAFMQDVNEASGTNLVYRVDKTKIPNFEKNLKTYYHNDDWSMSGSEWEGATGSAKGLYAHPDKLFVALYAAGTPETNRYIATYNTSPPMVYFDKKDVPKFKNTKSYLTAFDASTFKKVPSGEVFSDMPGKPVHQIEITDPFKFIKQQGWGIKLVDDLPAKLKEIKKIAKEKNIKYGAEGMDMDLHEDSDYSQYESKIEDFVQSLNPDDVGVEEIGPYHVHFEGFTDECQQDAERRCNLPSDNPQHLASYDDVYKEVIRDFVRREGGKKPLKVGFAGYEDYPVIYAVFENPEPYKNPDAWNPKIDEASGYIPSAKEKNDPRFKTALTVDVKPDAIKKNAKAFGFKTSRAGIPPQARADGKIAEDLMREFKTFLGEQQEEMFPGYDEQHREKRLGNWLAKSWAVKDGKPQTFYHATTKDFDTFNTHGTGFASALGMAYEVERHGSFFAVDPKFAEGFIEDPNTGRVKEGGRVLPVHLSIQSPIDLRDDALSRMLSDEETKEEFKANDIDLNSIYNHMYELERWELFDGPEGAEFIDNLQKLGFDGAIINESIPNDSNAKSGQVWVAFSPNQVKSIHNRGSFSPDDSRLTKESG